MGIRWPASLGAALVLLAAGGPAHAARVPAPAPHLQASLQARRPQAAPAAEPAPTAEPAAEPAVYPAVAPAPAIEPAPAPAIAPIPLNRSGQITDRVGALGGRKDDVARALRKLDRDHRTQLFVAYVRDFGGRAPQDWADATAGRNGLGQRDILLAVATRDRQYAVSASQDADFSRQDVLDVNDRAIEPALRKNDWAGAAIGGADGFAAVLEGRPVPTPAITPGEADPGAGSNGNAGLLIPAVVLIAAAAATAYAFSRRRRRTVLHSGTAPHEEPLPDLDARAKQLLVGTDDAVRTSVEELGFASAQFGEEAAGPFDEAVAYAKEQLTQAFRLRQRLDDAFPESDAEKRGMLEEIVKRCTDAGARLDAESGAFDRLRAMVANAPEVLANAEAAAARLPERISAAEAAYAALRETYAESAVAPVAEHPREAKDRYDFAAEHLTRARTALDGGDRDRAAVHVRAAEGAVDQAATLADSVLRRADELKEAAARLADALSDAEADLADARGVVGGTTADRSTADLQGRIARTETVLAEVRRESAGRYDPIAALRRLEEADAALEEALRGAREREDADQRARVLLDQALLAARSEIAAATDFITTHRGAVGTAARTRLHEAQRHLHQAHATEDAPTALQYAQQADALGRQARDLAEQDAAGYGGSGPGAPPMGGGLETGMLGGIILGGMLGGGRGMGGFGGGIGGFGGGFPGPGSFGGGGTRGRMGGGGRF